MAIEKSISVGFELTRRAIKDGIVFGEKNILSVSMYLIVAGLVAIIGCILGVGIGAGIILALSDSIGELGATVSGIVLAFVLILIAITYSYAAQFGAIEYIYSKKRVPYFSRKNLSVAFKWVLFGLGIILLVLLGLVAIIIGINVSPLIGILAIILFTLIILGLCFVSIITYYVMQELSIKKKGPVEAIKSSYQLIKNNFWETVSFAVLLWIGSYIIQLVPGVIFYILLNVGIIASIFSPLFLGLVLISAVLYILVSLIISSAVLIAKVGFYRELTTSKTTKDKPVKKAVKKTKKKKAV